MIKDEKGITLVELLGALALMSVVILLISSVHIFGQKQYVNQSQDIENQSNVRLAIASITKDIRTTDPALITSPDNSTLIIDEKTYTLTNNKITVNGNEMVSNIAVFNVNKSSNDESNNPYVDMKIESISDPHGNTASLSTVIYLRE
ncbi:PilW family protein [Aquibacillus rhizosphaerae]|uniref:Prepilin-type N-terminal cleavage/methylation domain-containing protein n=1 Tax=Aquibacillus rhizosphaerae TaxID=3051431 RepID=A0ABT7L739_9BACI|nr:prepilin-type N-terminal cleavage/methylation domain-containing protein [Aquibacillus sp. LR5S19]MDL4841680.1 prepilin-type N-terminal cleavage/methylation domain-containing protein [Aquibacillus sp. LR5S19]